jgi:kinase
MRPPEVAMEIAVAVAVLLAGAASSAVPAPAALMLERALPHKGVLMEHLMEWDRARHSRRGLLDRSSSIAGVVDFPVEGSANPYMVRCVNCFAFVDVGLWLDCGFLETCTNTDLILRFTKLVIKRGSLSTEMSPPTKKIIIRKCNTYVKPRI